MGEQATWDEETSRSDEKQQCDLSAGEGALYGRQAR